MLPARTGQRVQLDAPAALRRAPSRGDPSRLFEFEQRGIERSLVHRELIAADLLDAARDAVSVERAQGLEGLQHHQAQAAVEHVVPVGRHVLAAYSYKLLAVNRSRAGRDR